ncbi:unnamed protein product [Trichobilharzia szidati]|nr:unnamed protein product [Trichobilharzia szidati]
MPIPSKPRDPLEKVIPRNPKYEDIEPTIDTGASLSKYLKRMEEIRENYKMKDNEIFKRMKVATFVQLILQIAEVRQNTKSCGKDVSNVTAEIADKSSVTSKSKNGNSSVQSNGDPPPTARSTLESLVTGIGEFDTYFGQSRSHIPDSTGRLTSLLDYPYLLLDVRDRDEYDACHIITARNYPIAMLSRSVNFETTEMLAYRNRSDHIIIIYDEDERLAPRAATTLVQRGYCNLFMLSGGLKVAWKLFPEGLIIGTIPLSISCTLKSRGKSRLYRPPTCQNSLSSSMNKESCIHHNSSDISLPKLQRSTTPLIYCAIGTRDNVEGDEEFLPEDLVRLTLQLEKGVDDGRSVRSNYARSTVSSMRYSASGDRKPFR